MRVELLGPWHYRERPSRNFFGSDDYIPDHDIAILPFTRLPKWEYTIPTDLHEMIPNEKKYKEHSFLYRFWRYGSSGVDISGNLPQKDTKHANRLLIILRIEMDKYLDGMKGETFNYLRSERFENWFIPGDSWESTYQDQLLKDLSTNFKSVMDLNYRLQFFRERYTSLILMYHAGWASLQLGKPVSSAAARHSPVVYSEWDPSIFSKVWQKGIRPDFERRYSHKDSQTFASYTKEGTKRGKFWSELDWWSYSACGR